MAKLNIRAGDIPETDQEVEKILEKMETKPAKKRPLKNKRETAPAVKEPAKPKVEKIPTLASQGLTRLGYTKVTAQTILDVFDDVHAGMTDDEITVKYHLAPGIVQWIRTGYSEYKRRFTPQLEAMGKTYPEPIYRPRVKQPKPESGVSK